MTADDRCGGGSSHNEAPNSKARADEASDQTVAYVQGNSPDAPDPSARRAAGEIEATIDLSSGRSPGGSVSADTVDPSPSDTSRIPLGGAPADNVVIQDFGEYELLEEIARGGMGVVFRARQKRLNRTVALKMILAGEFAGADDVQRFHSEAEAAANLEHSGIVPIYEVGEHEGRHFFSMGFVEGVTLSSLIEDGPIDGREAARLVAQVADAIAYAHQRSVIHRDLKPGNILLDTEGQPKVTDFGLSKRTDVDSGLTGTGQILGTPSYMAPEQAAAKTDEIGPLSDVYALGAILYCLITGRPPFQAANVMDTLLQVINQEPVSPRQLNTMIDRDLETICLKSMEKSPGRRYETAAALATDLRSYLKHEPINARPISVFARGARWCKRNPIIAGLSMALVVSLLAGLVGTTVLWLRAENLADREAFAAEESKRSEAEARAARTEAERSAAETQRYLNTSRRDVFALQLARAAAVGQETPAIGLQLLDNCNKRLRDFAWKHARYSLDFERFSLPGKWTAQVIAADGKKFAVGNALGEVAIWDVDSLKEMKRIQGPRVIVLAIDPMLRTFAASDDRTLSICDLTTGAVLKEMEVGLAPPNTATYSPDGHTLAVFERNMNVESRSYLVELTTYKRHPLGGEDDPWYGGSFSHSGKYLAMRAESGRVAIYDMMTMNVVWETKTEKFFPRYVGLNFSVDDAVLAYIDGTHISVFDLDSKETQSFTERLTSFNAAAVSADRTQAIGASQMGPIQIWDIATGTPVRRLHVNAALGKLQDRPEAFVEMECFPDGRHMLSRGTDSHVVRVWHSGDLGGERSATARRVEHWKLACHPDGQSFVVASPIRNASNGWGLLATPGSLKNQSVANFESTIDFATLESSAVSLAYSGDGGQLFVGCGDGSIAVWDFAAGRWRSQWTAHERPVTALALCNEEKWILSTSGNPFDSNATDAIKIWDAGTDEPIGTLCRTGSAVFDLTVSPDGEHVAYGDASGTVYMIDIVSRQVLKTISGHDGFVWSIAFDPARNRLAIGAGNYLGQKKGEVAIWDLTVDERVATLRGHAGAVFDVTYSPDGRTLASASYDQSIRLWDPETGQERAVLNGHRRWVRDLAFLPDSSALLSASGDGTIIRWDTYDRIRERP